MSGHWSVVVVLQTLQGLRRRRTTASLQRTREQVTAWARKKFARYGAVKGVLVEERHEPTELLDEGVRQ